MSWRILLYVDQNTKQFKKQTCQQKILVSTCTQFSFLLIKRWKTRGILIGNYKVKAPAIWMFIFFPQWAWYCQMRRLNFHYLLIVAIVVIFSTSVKFSQRIIMNHILWLDNKNTFFCLHRWCWKGKRWLRVPSVV